MSRLAKRLQKKCAANEWLTTAEKDRDAVCDAVIVSSKSFDLCPAYVLDLISTYADHGCKPELWNYTLIAHWSPTGWKFFKYLTWQYLSWSIVSHAHVIEKVSMSEEYMMVLESGIEKFQSQKGLRYRLGWDGRRWRVVWRGDGGEGEFW